MTEHTVVVGDDPVPRHEAGADVAERAAPHVQHRARLGPDHVDQPLVVSHEDATRLRAIVGVDAAEQRALARARRIGQSHALARLDGQADAAQHRELLSALRVQRERLAEILDGDGGAHGWSTEETSSWV